MMNVSGWLLVLCHVHCVREPKNWNTFSYHFNNCIWHYVHSIIMKKEESRISRLISS